MQALKTMSNIDSLAIHLIRQGHWAEAVCLYRDELGLSLTQAEEIVLELADNSGIQYPGRFLSWLAIAFAGFSLFGLAGVMQFLLNR